MDKLVSAVRPCVNSMVMSELAWALKPLRVTSSRDKSAPSTADRSIKNGTKLSVNKAAN
ncbi:MAG: hypothetical protein JO132_11875 [Streptosporangiaceae bacterium]|nr:hypothetical protein [Streptosporangiaceae bacterium]